MSSDSTIRPPKPRRVLLLVFVAAAGTIGLVTFGITDRAKSMQEVKIWTDEQAIPTVRLVQPEDRVDLIDRQRGQHPKLHAGLDRDGPHRLDDPPLGGRGEREPQVVGVVARIIVRDARVTVDDLRGGHGAFRTDRVGIELNELTEAP